MAKLIPHERFQILHRQLLEELVESRRQHLCGKTGGDRRSVKHRFAQREIIPQPLAPKAIQNADDAVRRAAFEILRALALEGLAGFRDQARAEFGLGGQVRQKIAGQIHGVKEADGISEHPRGSAAGARPSNSKPSA